ncbi:MAG: DUF4157 domain-containing protein [Gemmatimonadota bacterium]
MRKARCDVRDDERRRREVPPRLPDHLQVLFREFFPDVDLERVRVHGGLPWIARFAPISVRAMALGRHIYFDSSYDAGSPDGIAEIGHELAHVWQWRRGGYVLGPISFAARYVGAYAVNRLRGMSKYDAYRNIGFEREAARFERSIRDFLVTDAADG